MLKTDGIPPKINEQLCEGLLCQQYCYRGKVQQEVDILLLRVNDRWYQLYYEEGALFWRLQEGEPAVVESKPEDPFSYPLIDVGERYGLTQMVIRTCFTESLLNGARVTFVFEERGSLVVTFKDNKSSLRFLSNRFGV